jgi:hypothetical protein
MWEPRCPTTLWASTACYKDSFTFLPYIIGTSKTEFCILAEFSACFFAYSSILKIKTVYFSKTSANHTVRCHITYQTRNLRRHRRMNLKLQILIFLQMKLLKKIVVKSCHAICTCTYIHIYTHMSRGSSVCIVMGCQLDCLFSIPGRSKRFFFLP